VDGTGSQSYTDVGFGISGVETFGSATRDLFITMDLGEIYYGDERLIDMA
jgi:hypothetical protein